MPTAVGNVSVVAYLTAFVVSAAWYPATSIATLVLAYGDVTTFIRNWPSPTPVLVVNSEVQYAPPSISAATELIQLPPITIRFCALSVEVSSVSFAVTLPNVVAVPPVPDVTVVSGALRNIFP